MSQRFRIKIETTGVDQKEVSREVYTQVVTDLDLPSVIAAVNKMPSFLPPQMHIDEEGVITPMASMSEVADHYDQLIKLKKAVEFGGYLAKDAEQFMATLTEKDADAVGDMWGSMRTAIYDFRMRAKDIDTTS